MYIQCEPTEEDIVAFQQFLEDLVGCLDQSRRPQHYVAQQREIVRLKNNLVSNSFIIYGSTGSGKTSSVLWATSEQPEVVVIIINCDIDATQQQFIQTLTLGIKAYSKLGKQGYNAKKKYLIFENMKFDQLNEQIKSSGRKFVFAIKRCEKIAQMKKPTLFYNLLQWVNGPMKPYLGLVLISRAFHFTDRLQKRVKSRLTAKSVTLIRPQGQKIIKICLRRFGILRKVYSTRCDEQKKTHRKKTPYLKQKLQWLDKILYTIQHFKGFREIVQERMNAINNQFMSCLKVAFLVSLKFEHINYLEQCKFNKVLVGSIKEATLNIAPCYYANLIKQCPLYSILVLALIAHMGKIERSPYTMSTIFQIYREIALNNSKFSHLTTMGSSKICLQKALDKLLDLRIILVAGHEDETSRERDIQINNRMTKQLILSIPYQDLRQVIMDMDDIPAVIKEILVI